MMLESNNLPIPPVEMRQLVGPTDTAAFDNPTGAPIFDFLPLDAYDSVFDFGCGCGRLARQLAQQQPRPALYAGVDLHRGMVRWCTENLASQVPNFHFFHHDVHNYFFNPGEGKPDVLPFPVQDGTFTLAIAWSVFTHLTESQAVQYLHELRRILRPDGRLLCTWFFLDKRDFPMMQQDTNALYTSYIDPSAAVIFDRGWVRQIAAAADLTLVSIEPPSIKGYQWRIVMMPTQAGLAEAAFPADEAPRGSMPLLVTPDNPDKVGL